MNLSSAVGPFTPAPLQQLTILGTQEPPTLDDCLVITPSSTIPKRLEDLEKARGPLPLYIGAHTKDPVKMIKLVNLEGIEAGKAFQANLRFLAWTTANNADPMVNQLIINQMSIMTPGLAELIPRLISGHSLRFRQLTGG